MGNKQAKADKKAVAEALASADTPASQIYPLALREKDLETKVELFIRAAKAYAEEKDHQSSAMAYNLAGESLVKLGEWSEASDAYIAAMMAYSLGGMSQFEAYEEAIDNTMKCAKRSPQQTRQKATQDKIGQSILRMIESDKTGGVITLLVQSNLIKLYLKGDYFLNGLKALVERFKANKMKHMGVWSLLFCSAADHFIGQFALDGSYDEDIATYAAMAILSAYYHEWDVKTGNITTSPAPSPKNGSGVKKQAPKPKNDDGNDGDDEEEDEDEEMGDTDIKPSLKFPSSQELIDKFSIINVYKRGLHQSLYNIITAAESGDIEALDDQFHELYFSRRKNKYKLIETFSERYHERFEELIQKGTIQAGTWTETTAPIKEEKKDDDEDGKPKRDVIEDMF